MLVVRAWVGLSAAMASRACFLSSVRRTHWGWLGVLGVKLCWVGLGCGMVEGWFGKDCLGEGWGNILLVVITSEETESVLLFGSSLGRHGEGVSWLGFGSVGRSVEIVSKWTVAVVA